MLWRLLLFILCLASLTSLSEAEPVEVTFFAGGEGAEFYERVGEEFSRLRPGSPVRSDGDPAIADKLRVRILEGVFPEVTNADIPIWNLIDHGQVLALDEWLDGPSWDGTTTWRQTFLPGTLDQYSKNGKTYGVPLVYVVWSVYFNKKLFSEQGWSPPKTWSEMFELCQQMKSKGVAPMAFQGRYPFYAKALVQNAYYHLAGPAAYREQLEAKPGSYFNPAMIQALGILKTLSGYFQSGALGMSHTEAQLEFFQGRAGMLMCGSWLFSEMKDNIPDDFELGAFALPLPGQGDGDAGYTTRGGYWFVFKNSAQPEAGVEYLRFLTSSQVAGQLAGERGLTVAVAGGNDKLHRKLADVSQQLKKVKRTFSDSQGVALPGIDLVWTDTLSRLLSEPDFEAQQAAEAMEQGANAARTVYEHPDQVEVRHPLKAMALLAFLGLGFLASWRRSGGKVVLGQRFGKSDLVLFLAPALVVYLGFFVLPSGVALLAGMTSWDGLGVPQFVGTLNFRRLLLESDAFWSALANNLFLMTVIPALVLPLSLALAFALHRGVWGSRMFRIAFFFPNLMGVAGVLLWQQLYHPHGGPINAALVALGFSRFESFAWLSPQYLYYALIPMGVWGACGFHMVLYLAAMQGVPEDLYEAAELHGANGWQKFRFITLPMIWPTVLATLLFMLIAGMKTFETIWLLTHQSPTSDNHVVGTLMVRSMFIEQRIGQAAAIACLLFATVLVCSLLADRLLRQDTD